MMTSSHNLLHQDICLEDGFNMIQKQLWELCSDDEDEEEDIITAHPDDEELIKECTLIQSQELELLQAVFFAPGELHVEDDQVPVSLSISPSSSPGLDIQATLPLRYPIAAPPLFVVRAPHLDNTAHRKLQSSLRRFIGDQPPGEPILLAAVEWLSDAARNIPEEAPTENGDKVVEDEAYCRLWILSHHIYSRSKRRLMLNLAGDFQLSGFLLPGKPGIVCVEGKETDCDEWWTQIRSLHWKKISEKKRDKWTGAEGVKFPRFAELVAGDFSTFRNFLEMRGLFDVFIKLFGFNTHCPSIE